MGSRDPSVEGHPYKWKTWRQVNEYVNELSAGYTKLNLMPVTEAEGKKWKFMGVYAKNREEWTLSDMACMRQSGTTIAFYDTLGPAAVEFVIRQT
jgi:long-chain acyl-CoA synthetase